MMRRESRSEDPLGGDEAPGDRPLDADQPIDEDEPIPGTPHARVALVWGLVILVFLVAAFVWFIASNASRVRPGGVVG